MLATLSLPFCKPYFVTDPYCTARGARGKVALRAMTRLSKIDGAIAKRPLSLVVKGLVSGVLLTPVN